MAAGEPAAYVVEVAVVVPLGHRPLGVGDHHDDVGQHEAGVPAVPVHAIPTGVEHHPAHYHSSCQGDQPGVVPPSNIHIHSVTGVQVGTTVHCDCTCCHQVLRLASSSWGHSAPGTVRTVPDNDRCNRSHLS